MKALRIVKEQNIVDNSHLRDCLDAFVNKEFDLLHKGACNLNSSRCTPESVQIGDTLLHCDWGLIYADGHKTSHNCSPTDEQIFKTIRDIQNLIDAADPQKARAFELSVVELS